MTDRCIFCGDSPTTAEHVISTKLMEALMPRAQTFTTNLNRNEETGAQTYSWTKTVTGKRRVVSHEINCVCARCNNGWMQKLDRSLDPALIGLAHSELGRLELDGCRLLAAWVSKIAFLTDAMWQPGVFAENVRRSFRETVAPPERWTFWIASRAESNEQATVWATTLEPPPGEGTAGPDAAVFTIRMLFLVLVVLAPLAPGIAYGRTAQTSPYLRQFWPAVSAIEWPPPADACIADEGFLQEADELFRPLTGRNREPG